jgi:hypothetical protein
MLLCRQERTEITFSFLFQDFIQGTHSQIVDIVYVYMPNYIITLSQIKHKYFASITTKYSLAYNYIHYIHYTIQYFRTFLP